MADSPDFPIPDGWWSILPVREEVGRDNVGKSERREVEMKGMLVVMLSGLLGALIAPVAVGQSAGHGAGPISVMILDGQSAGIFHNWRITTPV